MKLQEIGFKANNNANKIINKKKKKKKKKEKNCIGLFTSVNKTGCTVGLFSFVSLTSKARDWLDSTASLIYRMSGDRKWAMENLQGGLTGM